MRHSELQCVTLLRYASALCCCVTVHCIIEQYATLCYVARHCSTGSKQQVDKVDIVDVPVMSTTVQTADSVRDLGIIVDSYLTMAPHVSAVC